MDIGFHRQPGVLKGDLIMSRLVSKVGLVGLASVVCLILAYGDAMAARKAREAKGRSHEIRQAKDRAKQFRTLNRQKTRTRQASRRSRQFPQVKPRVERSVSANLLAQVKRRANRIRRSSRTPQQVRRAGNRARHVRRPNHRGDWWRHADRGARHVRRAYRRANGWHKQRHRPRGHRGPRPRYVHIPPAVNVLKQFTYVTPPGPVTYVERETYDDRTFEKVMMGIQTAAMLLNQINGVLPPPRVGFPFPPPGLP